MTKNMVRLILHSATERSGVYEPPYPFEYVVANLDKIPHHGFTKAQIFNPGDNKYHWFNFNEKKVTHE